MSGQDEREAFRFTDDEWREYQNMPDQGYSHRYRLEFYVNRWMESRRPTPHVVTTVEEVHAMHAGGDRRWLETADGQVTNATGLALWLTDPENTGLLPAKVLTYALAPADREAQSKYSEPPCKFCGRPFTGHGLVYEAGEGHHHIPKE